MSATLPRWGCADELCNTAARSQSCSTVHLTKEMPDSLLVAVLGDQTLHRAKLTFSHLPREAEVALEPSLMFQSFSASRGKTRIWSKPVEELWSQVQDWALWYHEITMLSLCCYKMLRLPLTAEVQLRPLLYWQSYGFQNIKGTFFPLPAENYLTLKKINCLLFSLLLLGCFY